MNNLVDDYVMSAARSMGAALDWEALGLLHSYPQDYHFTKRNGEPDKRYANYPEVLAYWEAEQQWRAEFIERKATP